MATGIFSYSNRWGFKSISNLLEALLFPPISRFKTLHANRLVFPLDPPKRALPPPGSSTVLERGRTLGWRTALSVSSHPHAHHVAIPGKWISDFGRPPLPPTLYPPTSIFSRERKLIKRMEGKGKKNRRKKVSEKIV
ncbi:hypothetical protein CEXT_695671 [Caerostris extrusa]|uniref:Uncharacterized protein n=1 Tax=Caerostris extrusa TaxID=172846 RepID=A0AAV4YB12_CAEEX|nr:hypothetical protein CEXT_695671 [Caerostris extrusa]